MIFIETVPVAALFSVVVFFLAFLLIVIQIDDMRQAYNEKAAFRKMWGDDLLADLDALKKSEMLVEENSARMWSFYVENKLTKENVRDSVREVWALSKASAIIMASALCVLFLLQGVKLHMSARIRE